MPEQTQIPQIGPVEKVCALYHAYKLAEKTIGEPDPKGKLTVMSADKIISGLEPLISGFNAYTILDQELGEITKGISKFQENLEYTLFNSKGLKNNAPPTTGNLQYILSHSVEIMNIMINQYSEERDIPDFETIEAEGALNNLNTAIKDCYIYEDIAKNPFEVKIAAQNVLGSITELRKLMLTRYPKPYINSLVKLRNFAKGKEKVGFIYPGVTSEVYGFKDKTLGKWRRKLRLSTPEGETLHP